jgi:hypothetical protein
VLPYFPLGVGTGLITCKPIWGGMRTPNLVRDPRRLHVNKTGSSGSSRFIGGCDGGRAAVEALGGLLALGVRGAETHQERPRVRSEFPLLGRVPKCLSSIISVESFLLRIP